MTKHDTRVTPLDPILDSGFWKRNLNRLLGVAAVIVLGAALVHFLNSRGAQANAAGWNALDAHDADVELAQVKGTTAEPWALYRKADDAFSAFRNDGDSQKLEQAASMIDQLVREFPKHALVVDGRADSLKRAIASEQAWAKAHSRIESNPQPEESNSVTFKTELGDIVVGLYPEQAPEAVNTFLKLVRDKQLDLFTQASKDSYVLLSTKEDEAAKDPNSGENEIEKDDSATPEEPAKDKPAELTPALSGKFSDRNLLSHYKGSLSFTKVLPYAPDSPTHPRVTFYVADAGHRDNAEVVFGTVTKGLEILETISGRDHIEGDALKLKEPVAVESVTEGPGLATIGKG